MGRLIVALIIAMVAMAQTPMSWRSAPTLELMLPSSTDCFEPAIAVGPREQVYIVAGRRSGPPGSKEFDQKQVLWRSLDGGGTFEGPWPLTTEGHREGDQRLAVDRDGTIYVTYMDHADLNPGAPNRLRLARSRDEGRTFIAETIPVTRVVDKPELAVSPDGQRIAVVYESSPGPTVVTTADSGKTWTRRAWLNRATGDTSGPRRSPSLLTVRYGSRCRRCRTQTLPSVCKRRCNYMSIDRRTTAAAGRIRA